MTFATYIITNGLKAASVAKLSAKDAQNNLLHPGLPGMFTTPLIGKAAADNAPTTGWISSGIMSDAEIAYLNAQLPGPFEYSTGEYDTTINGQPAKVKEDGHGFMARKGYRMKPGTL
jgi:hypothetical protein